MACEGHVVAGRAAEKLLSCAPGAAAGGTRPLPPCGTGAGREERGYNVLGSTRAPVRQQSFRRL